MRVSPWFFSCCVWLLASASEDEHEGHDHGGHAEYEWAGIFEVPEAQYMWTAQKVEGGYADATMKMVVLPAAEATAAALDALAEEGAHSLEGACTPVDPGSVITPMEDKCYQLRFDANLWQSLYTIDTSGVAAAAFFTEHVPTEFESTAHYLKDSNGEDIEPLAELPEAAEEEDSTDWGGSLGAAVIVNLVTLVGVVMAVPAFSRLAAAHSAAFEGLVCAFAAGALLACAFFLLLFEATHLIGEGWEEEVAVLWRWGVMTLAGFLLPAVMDAAVALATEKSGKAADSEEAAAPLGADPRSRVRLIGAVTIGDFFHNLCDGFFIGAAFKGCGSSFGWGVSVATVLHELPQELADYAILTGSSVAMSPVWALLINFLSGCSVVLGVIVINSAEVSNSATGLLLAFGGGVYLYIAAVECMPKIHRLQLSARTNLLCLLSFAVGATVIGLILLDHEHCVPEGESHAHGH